MRGALMKTIFCAALVFLVMDYDRNARASECSQSEITRTATQADVSRKALLALPIGDGTDPHIPPGGEQAISDMKASLGAAIDAYMACAPPNRNAATIEHDLSQQLHALELEKRFYRADELPEVSLHYGYELSFRAKRWNNHPNVIGIQADFQIECGGDGVLLVFMSDGGPWREVIRYQSEPYKTVQGAFGSLDYAVSPSDETGNWYVVSKTIAVGCMGSWSEIFYAVLRPGPIATAPRILYRGDDLIYWAAESEHLWAGTSEFEVRFHSASIDVGVHNRTWIRHFTISGDTVQRVQPVALSPGEFADEWIVSSWEDASQWTATEAQAALEPLHERLNKIQNFDYDMVRRCTDRPDHYQVGLLYYVDQSPRSRSDEQAPYFLSVVGNQPYVMAGVSTQADPVCTGEEIPPTTDDP